MAPPRGGAFARRRPEADPRAVRPVATHSGAMAKHKIEIHRQLRHVAHQQIDRRAAFSACDRITMPKGQSARVSGGRRGIQIGRLLGCPGVEAVARLLSDRRPAATAADHRARRRARAPAGAVRAPGTGRSGRLGAFGSTAGRNRWTSASAPDCESLPCANRLERRGRLKDSPADGSDLDADDEGKTAGPHAARLGD